MERLELGGVSSIAGMGNTLANLITGNAASNALGGADGADTLIGGDVNDRLDGGAGTDNLAGGTGNDTYTVDAASDVVDETNGVGGDAGGIDIVNASASFMLSSYVENLTLTGTASIFGTGNALANSIIGNTGANLLSGGGGNDAIWGGAGNDTLSGGGGTDTLTGGAGQDVFAFDAAAISSGIDKIVDFSTVDDSIRLDRSTFVALAGDASGVLLASQFAKGSAQTQDHRVIYVAATGAIFYDPDGIGAGGAVQIATLGINLALTNADFVLA